MRNYSSYAIPMRSYFSLSVFFSQSNQKLTHSHQLFTTLLSETLPVVRQHLDLRQAVLDVLPSLTEIVTPILRPVCSNTAKFQPNTLPTLEQLPPPPHSPFFRECSGRGVTDHWCHMTVCFLKRCRLFFSHSLTMGLDTSATWCQCLMT